MNSATSPQAHSWAGAAAIFASLASQNLGASLAKQLFPVIGASGMTAVRLGFAAALLILLRRPWRSSLKREHLGNVIRYGATLGLMNLLIYQAFSRIPIGIAVAIEVLGPLAVVLAGARRPRDFLWLAMAVLGLGLLLPLKADSALDPLGVAFAMGAGTAWAAYIVFGKRLSRTPDVDAVTWGIVVAMVITAPIGILEAGSTLLSAGVLALGLGIAALSSALPYTLEMAALRRLPSHVFGMLVSTSPAVAALAGFLVLGERLLPAQWLAIGLIMFSVAGSTLSARQP